MKLFKKHGLDLYLVISKRFMMEKGRIICIRQEKKHLNNNKKLIKGKNVMI